MILRPSDNLKDLIKSHPAIAPSGRIKSFLFHPERKTLAPSCMLRVYKGDLKTEVKAISWYLQTNAGIKVHLHKDCLNKWKPKNFKWWFDIGLNHPDFKKMDTEATARHWTGQNVTVLIVVEDTMESIRDSWGQFIDAAIAGCNILVDLSAIRAAGKSSKTGIVSTGVFGLEESDEGFLSVYVWLADYLAKPCIENLLVLFGGLCKVIARGGTHKNGIVTTSVNYDAPFVWQYLDFPLGNIPGGSKKSIRFDEAVLEEEALCQRIVEGVNEESVFLEKITYQKYSDTIIENTKKTFNLLGFEFEDDTTINLRQRELFANVCMSLHLDHSASCLTSPFNIAQCKTPEEIPKALCAMTRFMCELHVQWRQMAHNYKPELYLGLEQDRQIGVTVMGLASFLAAQGVTYHDNVEGLEWVRRYWKGNLKGLSSHWDLTSPSFPIQHKIAYYLWFAYQEAAKIAREYNLERAFGIEPNQRCYLDYKDVDGYTVTRQIDPPFSNPEGRESAVHGEEIIQYHPLVELASEVGQELHQQHHEEWQYLMESTGLAHGTSFDLYDYVDIEWLKDFVKRSPLRGTYYQQYSRVNQSYLDKGNLCTIDDPDCVSCGS
jgi:hypothetical protein